MALLFQLPAFAYDKRNDAAEVAASRPYLMICNYLTTNTHKLSPTPITGS